MLPTNLSTTASKKKSHNRTRVLFPCCSKVYLDSLLPKDYKSICGWMKYLKQYHILIILPFLIIFCFTLHFVSGKCDTRINMTQMLIKTTNILKENNVEYWLDKGTLLGLVREGGLIPWEYDIDLGVAEGTCDKISALKERFKDIGLIAYDRKDYIPQKVKLTYDTENHEFYYSDPNLHDPCIRVYDANDLSTWVDIYWYRRIPKDQVVSSQRDNSFLIPENFDFQDDLLCCSEGIHEVTPNMCCGGCIPYKTVFPLQTKNIVLGSASRPFPNIQSFPRDSTHMLEITYGKDSLKRREIKGWKGVACGYWTNPALFFIQLLLVLVLFLGILGYISSRVFFRFSELHHSME